MAIVYRLERFHEGSMQGIYQSIFDAMIASGQGSEFFRVFCQTENHPHPLRDGMTRKVFYSGFIFGFLDITQLCEWFGPEQRQHLGQINTLVRLYEIDNNDPAAVVVGGRQIAFDPDKATLVAEFPMGSEMTERELYIAAEEALRLSR